MTDARLTSERVPMDPMRKTALVAGLFYLLTFISIPTWPSTGPDERSSLDPGLRQRHRRAPGHRPRAHRRPRRHRHRGGAVPGGQTAERGLRTRLRDHSHRRGGHDLHGCREHPVARDPAAGPGRGGRAPMLPRSPPRVRRSSRTTTGRSRSDRASCRASTTAAPGHPAVPVGPRAPCPPDAGASSGPPSSSPPPS